jgi:hypothetical protein
MFTFRNLVKQINQGLIGLQRFRREARQRAAEVGAIKGSVLIDFSGPTNSSLVNGP